ncbi:MAG TPA: DUF2938 family protein [Sphingobium sp.]|uniref:DUF2938 family protein n=1 Tax=Sphingobium sp. TaxID=1912891 RepID=UPI002ED0EE50
MILEGAAIGVGAMDVWAKAASLLPSKCPVNWAPVGRWVWHLQTGKIFHDDIGTAQPYLYESPLGWAFHYAVSLAFGVISLWLVGPSRLQAPTFLPAWIFRMLMIGAGWFLL